MKNFYCFFIAILVIFSALPVFAVDYDEVGAYYECYTLYPDFVDNVKNEGVTDEQIIYFLGGVEKHLQTRSEVLNEENFDEYMFDAIQYAFNLRKNIRVRNALAAAYPNSVPDAAHGIITEEFRPIYDTVKRYLFGIFDPVITISTKADGKKLSVFAHSAHLPDNCRFILAVYNADGILVHAKNLTADTSNEPIVCDCADIAFARAYAWDGFSPVCNPCTLYFE